MTIVEVQCIRLYNYESIIHFDKIEYFFEVPPLVVVLFSFYRDTEYFIPTVRIKYTI